MQRGAPTQWVYGKKHKHGHTARHCMCFPLITHLSIFLPHFSGMWCTACHAAGQCLQHGVVRAIQMLQQVVRQVRIKGRTPPSCGPNSPHCRYRQPHLSWCHALPLEKKPCQREVPWWSASPAVHWRVARAALGWLLLKPPFSIFF